MTRNSRFSKIIFFSKTLRYAMLLLLPFLSITTVADESSSPVNPIRVADIEVKDITVPAYYYQQVLKLALDKTIKEYGSYTLDYFNEHHTFSRLKRMVEAGDADIIWASLTPERKQKMKYIPVDLLKGYNNYRLLLISKKNQQAFKNIKNFADFKQLLAGNGHNWTDSKILRANGIEVATSVHYNYLVDMLLIGRFDYISRGLHEIHNDIDMFDQTYHTDLMIEQHLVLRYKHPIKYCFFVTRNNKILAERVERGLEIAEKDGSLLKLFKSIPSFKIGIEEMKKKRIEIFLDNSLVTKK